MNYFITSINPQVADTSNVSSFSEQNQLFSAQKKSILSSDFHSKKMDSLVQVVTQKRRIRPQKRKTIKVSSSFLKVKKDSFFFLTEIRTKPIGLYKFPSFNREKVLKKEQKVVKRKEKKKLVKAAVNRKDTLVTVKPIVKELPKTHNFSGDYGIAIILLLAIFLLAYVRFQFNSKLKYYYKSFFNFSFFKKMIAERNIIVRTFSIFLSVIMLFSFSLAVLFAIYMYNPPSTYYLWLFFYLFSIFIVYFLILRLLHYFVGFVIETQNFINEFDQNLFYYYRVLGVLLLPILVFIPYTNKITSLYLLFLAGVLFFIIFVMRWLRSFVISFNHRVSFLYMILYLCALEILPLLVVLKLIEESY